MSSGVHTEASSTTSETVTFGSVFPAVADLAEQDSFVDVNVGRVKHLVAHAWLKSH